MRSDRSRARWAGLLLVAATAAVATGCARNNYTSPDRYERGLVVCLSGAGGMMGECRRIRQGLDAGGVNRAIEIFEWSGGEVLTDQASVAENHRKAAQLARRIEAYLHEYSGRPVHLVGLSAGTGLLVWAMEDLAGDGKITGAILLSSSLDSRYDLTRALERVTDGVYSFSSVFDTILSLGVALAGTVDRGGGLAGGLFGFSVPDNASENTRTLYKERFTQIAWRPGDMILGHIGDHLGATNPVFVRTRIAPLVLGRKPEVNPEVVKVGPSPAEGLRPSGGPPAEGAQADRTDAAAKPPTPDAAGAGNPATPEDKKRFVDWNIGAGPGRSIEESQFLAEPGRLP